MPARFLFLGIAILGGVAIGWYAVGAGRPVVNTPVAVGPSDSAEKAPVNPHSGFHTALGNSGCAAQGCHGAANSQTGSLSQWGSDTADLSRWRNSSVIFNGHDPHRKAYESLRNELSTQIQARLGSKNPAFEDARCLACHSNPTAASETTAAAKTIHSDGVSCESCHGNASGWIGIHTSDHKRALDAGLRPLNNVGVRAETCMGCHVGAPANAASGDQLRDMNHDLVAAGHPRLNFDFATYLERLPAHWTEKNRDAKPITLKSRADAPFYWLVGRYAANEAAYRLLADRAAGTDRAARPWPELAEHDCFSCHRELTQERIAVSTKRSKLTGVLGREEPSLLHIVEMLPKESAAVEKLMSSGAPAAAEIAKISTSAAGEWRLLREQAVKAGPTGSESATILDRLFKAPSPKTWAEASQRFYILEFLNRLENLGAGEQIESLRSKGLQFERKIESVKNPETGETKLILKQDNSPTTLNIDQVGDTLKKIAEQLAKSIVERTPSKK